jgi:hypothetical protein
VFEILLGRYIFHFDELAITVAPVFVLSSVYLLVSVVSRCFGDDCLTNRSSEALGQLTVFPSSPCFL